MLTTYTYKAPTPPNRYARIHRVPVVAVGYPGDVVDSTGLQLPTRTLDGHPNVKLAEMDLTGMWVHWDYNIDKVKQLLADHPNDVTLQVRRCVMVYPDAILSFVACVSRRKIEISWRLFGCEVCHCWLDNHIKPILSYTIADLFMHTSHTHTLTDLPNHTLSPYVTDASSGTGPSLLPPPSHHIQRIHRGSGAAVRY